MNWGRLYVLQCLCMLLAHPLIELNGTDLFLDVDDLCVTAKDCLLFQSQSEQCYLDTMLLP